MPCCKSCLACANSSKNCKKNTKIKQEVATMIRYNPYRIGINSFKVFLSEPKNKDPHRFSDVFPNVQKCYPYAEYFVTGTEWTVMYFLVRLFFNAIYVKLMKKMLLSIYPFTINANGSMNNNICVTSNPKGFLILLEMREKVAYNKKHSLTESN